MDLGMKNQNTGPLNKLVSELSKIYKRFENIFDWKNIDAHESLTFLDRNYRMKPSEIARKLLYLVAFIVFYIEGLRTFTILMCYILPIGIMILKLCEVMKATNKKSHDTKQKLKQSELDEKSVLQKNESELSINSKKNDTKIQPQHQQETKVTKLSSLPSQPKEKKQSFQSAQSQGQNFLNQTQNSQQTTANELCKVFICYFAINLVVELCQPVLLLILQTLFSLGQVGIASVQELVLEGNLWVLLLVPFRFISTFLIQIFAFTEANAPSKLIFIILRVFLSAILLNLNEQQKNFSIKFFFEKTLVTSPPQLSNEQKSKKE